MRKRIAILGSTGSIGTQALNVVDQHSDILEAYILTAGKNASLLVEQARKFRPYAVTIADEQQYDFVKDALADLPIQVYAGEEAICQIVDNAHIDLVLVSMVGFSGLRPTLNAIRARKPIALANKETLVVAGQLVTGLAKEMRVLSFLWTVSIPPFCNLSSGKTAGPSKRFSSPPRAAPSALTRPNSCPA